MPIVKFINVGRNSVTWEAELKNVDEDTLVREIKRKKALMSQDISVEASDIIVGVYATVVGRVEILLPQEG
jgi:hypothetical protein